MLEIFCDKQNLEFPNDRLAELKDTSYEIVRAFEDERADPEDTVDSALEYLVCCSDVFSKERQKLRQRLIDFQDAILINDFDELDDNSNIPDRMTLTGFTEIEPTVEQPISPTEGLSDEELAHQFSQALNKDIYEAEELHEKILSEAKAGPWSQVQPRKTKAPVRLLPEEQLANLFPEHSKKQIDKALIECGTVDDAAIYLMSIKPGKAAQKKKKPSLAHSLEKLEGQLSRTSTFVEREIRSHIPR